MKSDAKIVVTVDVTNGAATYLNGPAVSHPRLEALLCYANIDLVGMIDGQPIGLATNQRTATPAQSRYMIHRDGPCRTPGCPGRGPTQFHHVLHYAHDPNAGTSTTICIALCMGCHHDHHDGRLTITGDPEGTINFTYTDGRTLKSTITHQQPPLTAAWHNHATSNTQQAQPDMTLASQPQQQHGAPQSNNRSWATPT